MPERSDEILIFGRIAEPGQPGTVGQRLQPRDGIVEWARLLPFGGGFAWLDAAKDLAA